MRTQRLILIIATVAVITTTVAAPVHAKPKKQPCVASLSVCPDEGCGGDPALNQQKNREDVATDPTDYTVADMLSIEVPDRSEYKDDRSKLEEWGEGSTVSLSGYLIYAGVTKTPESCNCFLQGVNNNDFHLNLVDVKNDSKNESVVVEITPRVRKSGWTLEKLQQAAKEKRYVRVRGWLLLDSAHTGASRGRGTPWEVHPVTDCDVCTGSRKDCDQGKKWKSLASWSD